MKRLAPRKRSREEVEPPALNLGYLPAEMLQAIADFLSRANIVRLRRVNQHFYASFGQALKRLPSLVCADTLSSNLIPNLSFDYKESISALPNGKLVLAGVTDKISVFDSVSGTRLLITNERKNERSAYWTLTEAISLPNNNFMTLAVSEKRGRLKVWDSQTGQCVYRAIIALLNTRIKIIPLASHKIILAETDRHYTFSKNYTLDKCYTFDFKTHQIKSIFDNTSQIIAGNNLNTFNQDNLSNTCHLNLMDVVLLESGYLASAFSPAYDENETQKDFKSYLKIWAIDTGTLIQTMSRKLAIRRLASCANGELATFSEWGFIDLWDTQTGCWLKTISLSEPYRNKFFSEMLNLTYYTIDTLPHGQLLVSFREDMEELIYIIDPTTEGLYCLTDNIKAKLCGRLLNGQVFTAHKAHDVYRMSLWTLPAQHKGEKAALPVKTHRQFGCDIYSWAREWLAELMTGMQLNDDQAIQLFIALKESLLSKTTSDLERLVIKLNYFKLPPQAVLNLWGADTANCLQQAQEVAHRAYYWQGKVRLPLMLYNLILWLEPQHYTVRIARATLFKERKELKFALMDVSYLLQHFPHRHEAYYLLMQLLLIQNCNNVAKLLFERFNVYSYKEAGLLRIEAEVLLLLGRYDETLAKIADGLTYAKTKSEVSLLLLLKATTLCQAQRYRAAIKVLESLLEDSAACLHEICLRLKGDCLLALKDEAAAMRCYQRAWIYFDVAREQGAYEYYEEQNRLVEALHLLEDKNKQNILEKAPAFIQKNASYNLSDETRNKALPLLFKAQKIYKAGPVYHLLAKCYYPSFDYQPAPIVRLQFVLNWLRTNPKDFWDNIAIWFHNMVLDQETRRKELAIKETLEALSQLLPHELLRIIPVLEAIVPIGYEMQDQVHYYSSVIAAINACNAENILYSAHLPPPQLIQADIAHYQHSYGLKPLKLTGISDKLQQHGLFAKPKRPRLEQTQSLPLSEEDYNQLISVIPAYF